MDQKDLEAIDTAANLLLTETDLKATTKLVSKLTAVIRAAKVKSPEQMVAVATIASRICDNTSVPEGAIVFAVLMQRIRDWGRVN